MDLKGPKSKLLAFVLGFTSILGQVLEASFSIKEHDGNETAYAVILASWLFWVALGSSLTSVSLKKNKNPQFVAALFFWLISFILPVTIFATRCLKPMSGIGIGEIVGIETMCSASFLILAPLTFLLGGLFAALCKITDREGDQDSSVVKVSSIYLWEANGAIVGGLLFSFVLLHILPAMQIAFIVSLINIIAVMLLYGKGSLIFESATALLFLGVVCFSVGLISEYDHYSRGLQWKGREVLKITDSIYGNLTLLKEGEQFSLYENGLLSFTTGDDLSSEENIHYALLSHPDPKDILLISGGIAGGIAEALKYEDAKVDYVELDSKVIGLAKDYLPKEITGPLSGSRVQIFTTDARFLVKTQKKKYDCIIVALGDPTTALLNRYYSLEFFKEAAQALNPQGILSFRVSSSENYLNDENRALLRSLHSTLKKVFEDVGSIPGDTHTFIASKNSRLSVSADTFIRRLRKRGIHTKFVHENYLPYTLSADRISIIEDILEEEGKINTDMRPIGYLYDIVLWSTHFNAGFSKTISALSKIKRLYFGIAFLVLFLILYLAKKRKQTLAVSVSIMTTGFSEIIFQLIVIIAFQSLYGYAYYKIGLIISSFMIGLSLGSIAARRILAQPGKDIMRIYREAQAGIFLYPCLLPFVFILFRDRLTSSPFAVLFSSVFAFLPIIAGFLGGLQFPLANFLIAQKSPANGQAAASAGKLYAMDVFGSSIGALLTGLILIPLLGIDQVAYLCALLNFGVFLLLVL